MARIGEMHSLKPSDVLVLQTWILAFNCGFSILKNRYTVESRFELEKCHGNQKKFKRIGKWQNLTHRASLSPMPVLNVTYSCPQCSCSTAANIFSKFSYRYNFQLRRGEVLVPPPIRHVCSDSKSYILMPKINASDLKRAFRSMALKLGELYFGIGRLKRDKGDKIKSDKKSTPDHCKHPEPVEDGGGWEICERRNKNAKKKPMKSPHQVIIPWILLFCCDKKTISRKDDPKFDSYLTFFEALNPEEVSTMQKDTKIEPGKASFDIWRLKALERNQKKEQNGTEFKNDEQLKSDVTKEPEKGWDEYDVTPDEHYEGTSEDISKEILDWENFAEGIVNWVIEENEKSSLEDARSDNVDGSVTKAATNFSQLETEFCPILDLEEDWQGFGRRFLIALVLLLILHVFLNQIDENF